MNEPRAVNDFRPVEKEVLAGLACPECGHRQPSGDRCGACGYDGLLDLADARHVELLRDIDDRRREKHSGRVRVIAVAIGMAIVMSLWFIPGYWSFRENFAFPLFADQFAFMIGIALVAWRLLERLAPKPRFPYLVGR